MEQRSKHEECSSKHQLLSANNLQFQKDFQADLISFFVFSPPGVKDQNFWGLKICSKQIIWLVPVSDCSSGREWWLCKSGTRVQRLETTNFFTVSNTWFSWLRNLGCELARTRKLTLIPSCQRLGREKGKKGEIWRGGRKRGIGIAVLKSIFIQYSIMYDR